MVETLSADSARLSVFARLGHPVPEPADMRGEGVVNFDTCGVWMSDRLLTERMIADRANHANPLLRPIHRRLYGLTNRLFSGGKDLYFEGEALWVLNQEGQWDEQPGMDTRAVSTRNPLFIFEPLSRSDDMVPASQNDVSLRGIATSCFQILLGRDQFTESEWLQVASPSSAKELSTASASLQVFIWLDDHGRISRVSYEASFDEQSKAVLWWGTEFWEFGLRIDQEPPYEVEPTP